MNVTLKIDDELCRQARHRAVDAGMSLSGWVGAVVRRELEAEPSTLSLLDKLACAERADAEVDFPRAADSARDVEFGD
jgi:hypothetical protein